VGVNLHSMTSLSPDLDGYSFRIGSIKNLVDKLKGGEITIPVGYLTNI
jgi:hypothetical protein